MPITRIIIRSIKKIAVTIAVLLSSIVCTTQASAQKADNTRPNIVIILSDDAGYADFGFTGGTVVPTPNIDAIAHQGATLTQFYTTASVCSPSRAGFLTGRYQQRFGHHSNLTGEASRDGLGLPTSEHTIADHLKARGYRTGIIGKWHLGRTEELLPTSRGFDHFEGLPGGSRTYFPIVQEEGGRDEVRTMRREQRDADGEASSTILDEQALDAQIEDEGGTGFYVTDWIGDRAADYIKSHAGSDEPYYLFVSFTAPHTPMEARPTDLTASEGIEPERRRVYAAMMRSLDRAVGEITTALDDSGSADNTVVMFFNDNGGATNNGSDNGRYRGMKGSKWEGGVRVPAAVRWPTKIAPGTRFTPVVSSMDYTATAVALAGGPIEGAAPLDGRSLFPALTDTTGDALPDNAIHPILFWERGPAAAVRAGPWKLITTPARDPLLYHIPADPSETTNLAAERPDMVDGLMRLLADWRAETVAPLWTEGERWERNQRLKHDPGVLGREAERRYP